MKKSSSFDVARKGGCEEREKWPEQCLEKINMDEARVCFAKAGAEES